MSDPIQIPAAEKHSFAERYGIHPMVFGLLCLVGIFFLYQLAGGILTFIVLGSIDVSKENVHAMRWLTVAGQAFFILIPTLILGRLLDLDLKKVFPFQLPSVLEFLFVIVALVSLQRVLEAYLFLQHQIPVPEFIERVIGPMKKLIEELMQTLLHADSFGELLGVVFVVAVTPAVIEELMFRGLIFSSFVRSTTPMWAALVSGVVFGFYHMNPFEVVPLVVLGIFLGYTRAISGTLVIPIAVHFVNNALAVVAEYFRIDNDALITPMGAVEPSFMVVGMQFVLFGLLFAWSVRSYRLAANRRMIEAGGNA